MSQFRTSLLLGFLMVGAAFFAHGAKPTQYLADHVVRKALSEEIPAQLAKWRKRVDGSAFVIDPTQESVLNYLYSETLAASYYDDSDNVIMLSIAYGKDQSDGHDVHRPDLCYPAQGFSVLETRDVPIELEAGRTIVVRYMKTQKGTRVEPLMYWSTAGNHVYRTKLERKLIGIRYSAENLIPDGMVIRVSMLEKNPASDPDTLAGFIKDWYAATSESQRGRYFGGQGR